MKGKKKGPVIIEIKGDAGKKARREARVLVGIPKPARPLEERQAPEKKPKHKKSLLVEE
jgi:hypothetical protein